MAIEYGLELTGATADRVAGLLPDQDRRLDSGLLVVSRASSKLPFPHPVEEAFGFVPEVHVLFRFDKFTDFARQRHDMVRLVSVVLNDIRGDAVLLFGGELVWLLRTGGRLAISDRDDLWTPELLALLPAPYDRRDLPVL
jgi:hypothetical protein